MTAPPHQTGGGAFAEGDLARSRASAKSLPPADAAFQTARQHLEETGIWDWNDDVEFLGLSWVEFG
jgi:hypothetical protein